jgi:glycosyltransferase involved in cell wall biosynthesis
MNSGESSVDVILPARGPAPWLPQSLASIAAQSLKPAAVTLVDDGLEKPEEHQKHGAKLFGDRFRLLKNQGRGISAALNTGIQNSSARWIARMDADDVAHPDRFEKQVDFLATPPDEVLGCGTQVRFINAAGKFLAYSRLPASWEEIARKKNSQTCFVHSSLMLRREALPAAPYRSSMDGAEDVDLVLRLSEKGRLINLRDALLDYRIHFSQESFRMRARHTAVQELAFRLAARRRKTLPDPLEQNPDLAKKFIDWRLQTPGYIRARTVLTAMRYAGMHLSGRDFPGFLGCVGLGLKSFPLTASSLRVAWRVYRKAGAALLDSDTPFEALNVR